VALAAAVAPAQAIVGGGAVPEGQLPGWYAHIAVPDFNENGELGWYECGGSLVSDRCILTAANCVAEGQTRKLLRLPENEESPDYIKYPNWSEWDQSALTPESRQARIGSAPMPDGPPLGRLTEKESATKAWLGENFADSENFLNGTATMHPYYFNFLTNSGQCAELKNKRSCNQARPCAWNSTSCNFIGLSSVEGMHHELVFNDIALVVLDKAQPDVEKVTLSDSGDATERCGGRGRARRRCLSRLRSARRSTVLGQGLTVPNSGGMLYPPITIEGKVYETLWNATCAELRGAAVDFPFPFFDDETKVDGFITLPKRRKRLFKKWCTPGDRSYLNTSPGLPDRPKWTKYLERSTPHVCKQWYDKFLTENNWNANRQLVPVLPKDTALDGIVCAAQSPALFRESGRVPTGTCPGDSGGAILEGALTGDSSLGAQYGVVSFGAPRAYKRRSALALSENCAGLMEVCRCGSKVAKCGSKCEKKQYVGWMHERAYPTVFTKVAHHKDWLKQQESVCGKMRWSSEV
jgi:hypothetical protein